MELIGAELNRTDIGAYILLQTDCHSYALRNGDQRSLSASKARKQPNEPNGGGLLRVRNHGGDGVRQ